jgi:hypothetical protein
LWSSPTSEQPLLGVLQGAYEVASPSGQLVLPGAVVPPAGQHTADSEGRYRVEMVDLVVHERDLGERDPERGVAPTARRAGLVIESFLKQLCPGRVT